MFLLGLTKFDEAATWLKILDRQRDGNVYYPKTYMTGRHSLRLKITAIARAIDMCKSMKQL